MNAPTNGTDAKETLIQTPRLYLRPFSKEDEQKAASLLCNEAFMAFSPTGALNINQARVRFAQILKSYEKNGIGKFAVIEESSKYLIGYCGIESCEIDGESHLELGFRLCVNYRGLGYATEAASAVLRYAMAQGIEKVIAFTEPGNQASINVLQKLGFRAYRKSFFSDMPVVLFMK